ncbi:CdaR family protein [Anaerococcus sp. Marseille-P3915]|uniref:CdaR family protein n=1 Tax=Anaerococcus sp. Marseille-P3915 TaxID=2057799 RepID=UPI000D0B45BE|nr:CdaR family protein [Anaerococcus sp. Marseille-P3915]
MNSFLEKLKKFDDKSDNKLIILSIIVAVVMWTFVTTSTNPTANRTFRNLPLIIQNQDKLEDNGYTIVSKDEANTVSVRLTGSRNNLIGLDQSDIQASINVANVKEGINSLDVNIDTPTGIYVDHIDPKSINLNIQRIITKSMPVNIVIDDKLKDGKLVEVNEQRPKEIQISGPESIINKVDRIEAYINDAEYLDGKIHNVNVNVLDKGGKTVEGVDLDHKDINLSFLVYETKKVKVELKVRGELAEGYQASLKTLRPEQIVIKGQSLKNISKISTFPVNVSNIKASKSGEVKLDLPDGVEVYDGEDVINYRIDVNKKDSSEDE